MTKMRRVRVTVKRTYTAQDWTDVEIDVPAYASDDTIHALALDFIEDDEIKGTAAVTWSDRGEGYGGDDEYENGGIDDVEAPHAE